MIFVDAHVHIYDCLDLDILLDSALKNFQLAAQCHGVRSQPLSSMLLLTEGRSCTWFQQMVAQLATGRNIDTAAPKWTLSMNEETLSLTASRHHSSGEQICLVAGRQIVTAEKIEVLALFCNTCIHDGLSLKETVETIRQAHAIAVLPWGAGKWLGKRGAILQDFIAGYGGKGLFLGDNGGRPWFLPTPALFHLAEGKGISILPGTDPLPVPHEATRVGSFGFYLDHPSLTTNSPAIQVRDLLLAGEKAIFPFGQLQGFKSFMTNQIQLRFYS